jgi:CheY-like chemotaxis protein
MSGKVAAIQTRREVFKKSQKFIVKISMMRKKNLKGQSPKKERSADQTIQDPFSRLKQKMDRNIREIYRNREKIEKLAKSTIEELMEVRRLSSEADAFREIRKVSNPDGPSEQSAGIEPSGNGRSGLSLDYELANMKMITKILNLALPFETKPRESKKGGTTSKKPSKRKGKIESPGKSKGTDAAAKILIVEDDPTTIKIISHLLKQYQYQILSVSDAEEGLKLVHKEMPDLVLLDIMLPGMDGLQLLTKLRADQQTSAIPVLILSSLSGENDVLKGLQKGASDYILKPFSPQILFFKIKNILDFQNERIAYHRNL